MFEYKLKSICEQHGVHQTLEALKGAVAEGKWNPSKEFSIRRLAEAFMGPQWHETLRSKRVSEAEGVSASAFTSITGQLLVDIVKETYKLQDTICDKLFTQTGVSNGNLKQQIIPYIGSPELNDPTSLVVDEEQPIPTVKMSGQYFVAPPIKKVAKIMHISWETIYSDLTAQVVSQAQYLAEFVRLAKEFDCLNLLLGLVQTYNFNGNALNTYYSAPGSPFINLVTGFSLTDYGSINQLEQLIIQQKDPVTGLPIKVTGKKDVLIMPQSMYKVRSILQADSIRTGNYAQSGSNVASYSDNPLNNPFYDGGYAIHTSVYALNLLQQSGMSYSDASNWLLLGDFKKAFGVRVARPMEVVSLNSAADPSSPWNFTQDLVMSIRCLEQYAPYISDPRYLALGRVS